MSLDYDWIAPGLAQGSLPRPAAAPFAEGFDVVVFCAMEAQPKVQPPHGKVAILFPMDDNLYVPVTQEDAQELGKLAQALAQHIRAGRKVLTTCMEGRNRSGLVSALTLLRLGNTTPQRAISLVRSKRTKPALTNPMFERYILLQTPTR
jgi:protein-tyrosine phosphatase